MRPAVKQARLDRYICIDFEASALGAKSFPTEVGLADPVTGEVWATLIKPHPVWLTEGEWNAVGESVTGITRPMLAESGADPSQIYANVRRRVADRAVVSDSPSYDGRWFAALAAAAMQGTGMEGEKPPPLLGLIMVAWELAAARGRRPDIAWNKAELEVGLRFPKPHRAGPDARHNAEILRHLAGAS
ncbi:conserved protein of unknown function (plasmid) [Rhodovastum atsumiense]|uniref:Exonuclease domain-containing protein n=1 Tax=Rhodovastum atsumiense TaxID=504468 RepID=A0A5M6INM3_9PROT|nr:hypothetical protein [Rhodovastum atsumiense]KAA5609587.1 hypothetical protein F1189_23470 [Rhodovastum atsumiense]CAH2606352.1 conserved protein of unknown function [Rhodovastum atsumiense]